MSYPSETIVQAMKYHVLLQNKGWKVFANTGGQKSKLFVAMVLGGCQSSGNILFAEWLV